MPSGGHMERGGGGGGSRRRRRRQPRASAPRTAPSVSRWNSSLNGSPVGGEERGAAPASAPVLIGCSWQASSAGENTRKLVGKIKKKKKGTNIFLFLFVFLDVLDKDNKWMQRANLASIIFQSLVYVFSTLNLLKYASIMHTLYFNTYLWPVSKKKQIILHFFCSQIS